MTGFAMLFGTAAATWRLNGQLDLTADLVKICLLIGCVTAISAFISWSVIAQRQPTLWKGALAGVLTAIVTVPAPFAGSGFKREFLAHYRDEGANFLTSIFAGLRPAWESGLYIFEDMTTLSLLALILSAGVGFIVAFQSQAKQAGTLRSPQ